LQCQYDPLPRAFLALPGLIILNPFFAPIRISVASILPFALRPNAFGNVEWFGMRVAFSAEENQTASPRKDSIVMKSGDEEPVNGEAHDDVIIVSGDALNRVIVPLTVVHGHVQLLRRRIQRNQAIGSDELDRALSQMEQATRTMVAELSGIMGATSRSRRSWDPD
jgi:hypothetical protein